MGPTHDEITQRVAERRCGEVARCDDARVARRLSRQHLVAGVYRLEAGALLDDCCPFLQASGVLVVLEEAHGAAIHRQRVPVVQDVRLSGVKTRCGMARIQALPSLLCSDEALMPWVGCKAQQVRQGLGQRGRRGGRGSGSQARAAQTPWPTISSSGTCGTWRPCAMGACGPWRRPGALAPRSRAVPRARIWRPQHMTQGGARSPVRGAAQRHAAGCTRARSSSRAGTCAG
jgi:hypothetical protein